MKLFISSARRQSGSVLLISIMVSGILGVTLGSYLLVARSQHVSAVYSRSWHQALTLAEAGVEEALAQMNGAGISTSLSSGVGGSSADVVRRRLGSGIYEFSISSGPGSGATIYSTGHVTIPRISTTVSRSIVVTTTNGSLFTAAIAARTNLAMTRSTAIFADSFDSTDPRLQARNNGEVACLAGSLSLGSSKIYGDLLLGPTGTNRSSGLVTGKVLHDLNLDLPEVSPPSSLWLPAAYANEDIDHTLYRYVFRNDGDYTINSPGSIYVGPGAQVQVQILSPDFSASSIYVAGTTRPGKLVIYALQPGFIVNGNTVVESGKPANLLYLGLPGNTSLTLNGNTNFTGTIYAPSANFTNNVLIRRSGKPATFTGSCIANSVHINGAATFHFDEDLLRAAPAGRGFIITSWKEL